jgi:chromatin modification-related protein VID21
LQAKYSPLYKPLQTARKTLTTHDWMLARDQLKNVKTIQKIEASKKKNLWSLRQLRKHKSPPRSKTHWDCMMDEMKWMHTDFKEERKWKIAMAYLTSRAIMEWHFADDKSTVCVKSRIPEPKSLPSTPMIVNIKEETKDSPIIPSTVTELSMENQVDENDQSQESSNDLELTGESQFLSESTPTDTTDEPLKTDAMMGASNPTLDLMTVESADKMDTIDDSSSMPTTPNMATASLSSHIIQEYRTIMKNFDPQMPIMTLSPEEFGEFDANALFPDLLTYEPPNPNFHDVYFNELEYGKVTPISNLITEQISLKTPPRYSRKRDINGHPIKIVDDDSKNDIKPLPRLERYDTTPLVSRKSFL